MSRLLGRSTLLAAAVLLGAAPRSTAATLYWDGATVTGNGVSGGGNGAWTSGGSGWDNGASATWNNAANDTAVFGGTAGTVTLGSGVTAGGLTFDTAGYVVTGNTLTLAGATPTITANQNATISSIVAGTAGFTKAGAGTLTLSGNNTYTGPVTINAGTLAVGVATLSNWNNNGSTYVATGSNSTLALNSALTVSELTAANFASVIIKGSWITTATNAAVQTSTFTNDGTTATFWAAFWDGNTFTKAVKLQVTKSGSDFVVRQTDARYVQANIIGSATFATQIASANQPPIGSSGYGVTNIAMIDAGSLGVADVTLNGGSLSLSDTTQVIGALAGAAGTTVTGSGFLTVGSGNGGGTYSGVISGGLALTKVGSGTQVLAGANTYTASTTVNAGTVRLGNAAGLGGTGLGAGTAVASGATLDLNGQAVGAEEISVIGTGVGDAGALVSSTGSATLSGNVILTGNAAVGGAGNLAVSGAVSGAFALTKVGNGTLTLSAGNSYSGGTVLSQGGLVVTNGNGLGSGSVTVGDASSGPSNLSILLGSVTMSRAITVTSNGAGTVTLGASGAVLNPEFSGAITLSNRDVILAGGSNTDRLTFTGGIGGTGNVSVTGPGRVMFLTAANTFAGNLTVQSGATLQLHWGGAGTSTSYIPDASVLTVDGTLKLAKGANSETVGGLSGAGTVMGHDGVTDVASALVIDNAGNHTFSGVLSNGGATGATLSLTKTGAGTQTLSGPSTHTGGTAVQNGVLALVGGNNRLSASSAVVLGSAAASGKLVLGNGTAAINQTLAGLTATGSGGSVVGGNASTSTLTLAIASGNNAFSGSFGGAGTNENKIALTKTGAGTLTLSGGGTVTHLQPNAGTLAITAGTLTVTSQFAFDNWGTAQTATVNQSGGTLVLGSGANYYGSRSNNQALTYNLSGGPFDATAGNFFATWDGGSNNPVFTVSGSGLLKVAGIKRANTVNDSFNGIAAGTLEMTGGRIQVGSDGIGNTGGGGTVYNTIRFGGGTVASAAAFTANANQAIVLTGTNGATTFDTTDGNITLAGALSGAGSLLKAGSGDLTLGAANSYAGGTTVQAGKLILGNAGALGSGSVTVSGGVLDLAGLAPINLIVISGGSLLNESAWAAAGSLQVSGNVGSAFINALPTAEIKVAAGASVNLTGVTKDVVFEGGSLSNLSGFSGKLKVKSSLDLSAADPQGEVEVAAGGTVDFGNRASAKTVKFTGGTVTGAAFTGNVEVAGSGVALGSGIQAGTVRLTAGNSAAIQSGFSRAITFEGGALSGLQNYSGALTVAGNSVFDLDGSANSSVTTGASITVAAGSTLSGSGTINGAASISGTHSVGNSPGTQTFNSGLSYGSAAIVAWEFTAAVDAYTGNLEIPGGRGADYDAINVSGGNLTIASGATLQVSDPIAVDYTSVFWNSVRDFLVFDVDSAYSVSGAFSLSHARAAAVAGEGSWGLVGSVNGDEGVYLRWTPVPEPSTYGLILGGLALAGAALRRRRAKKA